MTEIDDLINKLQTKEGKRHATTRHQGGSIDSAAIVPFMHRAQHYMKMAQKHEIAGDKKEAKINYKQAMLAYERAGVFSYAGNVAGILEDTEMQDIYYKLIMMI